MTSPETTKLHATMTALSSAGWEVRCLGACRYRITTRQSLSKNDRSKVARMFHSDTALEFMEEESNDD